MNGGNSIREPVRIRNRRPETTQPPQRPATIANAALSGSIVSQQLFHCGTFLFLPLPDNNPPCRRTRRHPPRFSRQHPLPTESRRGSGLGIVSRFRFLHRSSIFADLGFQFIRAGFDLCPSLRSRLVDVLASPPIPCMPKSVTGHRTFQRTRRRCCSIRNFRRAADCGIGTRPWVTKIRNPMVSGSTVLSSRQQPPNGSRPAGNVRNHPRTG